MSDSYDFAIIGAGLAGSFVPVCYEPIIRNSVYWKKAAAAAVDSAADVTKASVTTSVPPACTLILSSSAIN